jgi:chaperonin cofactor prefoldin
MRPCIIGIGGTGGKVLKEFLRNEDISILGTSLGKHIAFGGIKGIWMDFDTQECIKEKFYSGRLEDGHYPGFIVPPEVLKQNCRVKQYILDKYGYDLRKQGFDRRAEYMKAIFEIFQADPDARNLSMQEYSGAENPLLAYLWFQAISRFVTIAKTAGENRAKMDDNLRSKGGMEAVDEGNDTAKNALSGQSQEEVEKNRDELKDTDTPPENKLKSSRFNNPVLEKVLANGQAILKRQGASQGDAENICESIMFIASLGGGTGTGFINPLTSYIRSRGSLAALALCLFTEKGIDSKKTSEEQRDLGAIIAMYDLLTKRRGRGIDGLILIDNQILQSKYGGRNYAAMNRAIFESMKPLIDQRRFPDIDDESLGIQRVLLEGRECPGVLVPCHFSIDSEISERDLIIKALEDGKLFPCDHKRADEAYIFSRGLLDPSLLQKELQVAISGDEKDKKIVHVYPKIGDSGSAEILILLRNPYGNGDKLGYSRKICKCPCKNEEEWKKTLCKTFEQRIYCATCMALKYLEEYEKEIITAGMPPVTKFALGSYLFGLKWIEKNLEPLEKKNDLSEDEIEFKKMLQNGKEQHLKNKVPFLVDEFEKSLARLENGDRPIFRRELNIFALNKISDEVVFCWEKVPGEDNQKLLDYLAKSFHFERDKVKIKKIDNDMTIEVLAADTRLLLKLNEETDRVIMEVNGEMMVSDLVARKENGELRISASRSENGSVTTDIKRLKPMIQSEIRNILTHEYGIVSRGK